MSTPAADPPLSPVVILDNRDSFVFNLARYLQRLGAATEVLPAHETPLEVIEGVRPAAVVISPGPCTPAEAGISIEAVRWAAGRLPVLGVCLGHQVIAAAYGARIVRAARPLHGRTTPIHHEGGGILHGLPSPFAGCRYHSLVVDEASLPEGFEVTARDPDGTVMAIEHASLRLFGVQFHPEAILTDHGFPLLAAFLKTAGLEPAGPLPSIDSERPPQPRPAEPPPVVSF